MKVGYARISTIEQNEERQIKILQDVGCEKIFLDKCSGKDMNRPKLQEMLNFVREGDTLYVDDLSRLGRSTKDLLSIIDTLEKEKVKFVSIKEQFDTNTPVGRLMLTCFAAIAEFERSINLQRTLEGVAIAKAKGKYKGRVKKKRPLDWAIYAEMYWRREISLSALARQCRCSRPTAYMWLKEDKGQQLTEKKQ